MKRPLYLDYNSTAPLDERVFEAMRPFFLEDFGNAGSRTHSYGQRAKEGAERAREQVATLLGVRRDEVIFTSGATEANNLAILGLAAHGETTGRKHVLATAVEHKAVLEPLERLRAAGFTVELVPVTAGGYVEPDAVKARLRADTLLVSVMHANNETGVLQPVREIAALLEGTAAYFHVDAAQTYGKEVDALRSLPYNFLSVSGHKIYGPKGIGALVARRRGGQKRPLTALMVGGGQEMGLRPGTLPVPLVVGLGAAARLADEEYVKRNADARQVKESLLQGLAGIEHVLNGDHARAQPHVVNVRFTGIDSEALILSLRETIAISNGAACTSASYTPSHVLKAMGLTDDQVASSVRISWGPGVSTIPLEAIREAIRSLRPD